MASPERKLFREKSLEQLSSLDDLNRLMPVAPAMDWLLIAVTGIVIALLVVWSFVGVVPTIVSGRGIIARPRQTMDAQTTVPGRILSLTVGVGDQVRAGSVIATLDQSDMVKRVQQNRAAVKLLVEQDQRQDAAARNETALQSRQDE